MDQSTYRLEDYPNRTLKEIVGNVKDTSEKQNVLSFIPEAAERADETSLRRRVTRNNSLSRQPCILASIAYALTAARMDGCLPLDRKQFSSTCSQAFLCGCPSSFVSICVYILSFFLKKIFVLVGPDRPNCFF